MRKLSQIMKEIIQAGKVAKTQYEAKSKGTKAHFQALARNAESQLQFLSKEYKDAFKSGAEIILLDGPQEALDSAVASLSAKGIITVNAQEFYERTASHAAGKSSERAINVISFMELQIGLNSLLQALGVRLMAPLHMESGNPSIPLAQNYKNLVRKQIGTTAEISWVYLKGVDEAVKKELDSDPLPVVVYGLDGATEKDYRSVFSNVHSVSVETGSEEEVNNFLKEIYRTLISQGKVPQKAKTKTEESDKESEAPQDVTVTEESVSTNAAPEDKSDKKTKSAKKNKKKESEQEVEGAKE